jgi:hypothetical protein
MGLQSVALTPLRGADRKHSRQTGFSKSVPLYLLVRWCADFLRIAQRFCAISRFVPAK